MLLRQQGIPVPEGKLAYSEISALAAAKEIGVPVAIKPFDGNQGKGVHLNLKTEREINAALKDAFTFSKAVIVERFIVGKDYAAYVKVYVSDGWITVEDGETKTIANVREIPITNNGSILCNIENCLAATAALYALSIPGADIAAGLTTYVQNEGRYDLHVMEGYSILLDYGHNLPGYEAVLQALPSYGAKRLIGIIGMPGDRQNESMKAVGELCARHFQKIYIKEDEHLRGRKKGEVSSILYKAVLGTKYPKQNIVLIDSELQALVHATENAEQGDLIVVFYEHLKPLLELINARRK